MIRRSREGGDNITDVLVAGPEAEDLAAALLGPPVVHDGGVDRAAGGLEEAVEDLEASEPEGAHAAGRDAGRCTDGDAEEHNGRAKEADGDDHDGRKAVAEHAGDERACDVVVRQALVKVAGGAGYDWDGQMFGDKPASFLQGTHRQST